MACALCGRLLDGRGRGDRLGVVAVGRDGGVVRYAEIRFERVRDCPWWVEEDGTCGHLELQGQPCGETELALPPESCPLPRHSGDEKCDCCCRSEEKRCMNCGGLV